jgi:RNA polymerase sigma-70 factor (ECF subfamily)
MANESTRPRQRVDDLAPEEQALLAKRVHEGDRLAEDELARLFHRRVLVMMLFRVRNSETARDLAQEVMLAVLLALRKGQLREEQKLAAFVYGTARNVVNGFFRSRPPESVALSPEHSTIDADDIVSSLHKKTILSRLLDNLEAGDRRILELILMEGLKSGEVARRLGLSSEVVRARKSRAIKKAIECMQGTRSTGSRPAEE